ncbi:pyruvate ferredoxin oxidoreductase [Thermocladium modestius]|uniref:2-oxoacid oxidoreductase (ferredoxin) n=1 Tax=Thermocladium modestius TaxID=62609 RepID=A0A830GX64_9CREN|nr:transketolase C-terminal domain-containing protein [Thermocladium modestius]GGP20028.1 pyruvate ferredoxin oxidoreductase [Thermocladium modestius]
MQETIQRQARKVLVGDHAVAEAVKLARAQVISAYPITPQTLIVERLAEMVDNKEINAKFIRVESEFAALASVYGASAGGARAFTATSSHGLFYMYEMLWWAAASRLPLVMAVVTRSLGPPWNIHDEHTDIMAIRDSGWIIGMAQNVQEALDMTLTAYKITEDPRVLLPVAVGLDGFILSHTAEVLEVPSQEVVDGWLPPRDPRIPYVIEPGGEPITMGNMVKSDAYHMLLKKMMDEAMDEAKTVIRDVFASYAKLTGRNHGDLVECINCQNSDYVVVATGAWSGDIMKAISDLREEGYSVGFLRIRFLRPFPEEAVMDIASRAKGIIVFDRDYSTGLGGIIATEIMGLVPQSVSFKGVIAGLAGVDVAPSEVKTAIKDFIDDTEKNGPIRVRKTWLMQKMEGDES